MRNIDACLYVRPSDRTTLEQLVADGKTPQKIVARARIVLLSGRGLGTNAIQREARVSKPTVWRWQEAYMDGGVERLLKDRGKGPRAGKKPISAEVRLAIVTRTAKEKPRHATHWSAYVGRGDRRRPHDRATGLEGAWPQAPSVAPHSSSPTIQNSLRKSSTLSGSTSTRPTRQSCSASTRKARFKRSIAPNRACR
jgi:hypothetical protein